MGVSAGLDHVTLFDLLVKECVEGVLPCASGIDLAHDGEYRKSGFSADKEMMRPRAAEERPVPLVFRREPTEDVVREKATRRFSERLVVRVGGNDTWLRERSRMFPEQSGAAGQAG